MTDLQPSAPTLLAASSHEELRKQSRDENAFRHEREEAGDQRFDVWLPTDVARWLREIADSEERTPSSVISSLLCQLSEQKIDDSSRAHDDTDAWERLAP